MKEEYFKYQTLPLKLSTILLFMLYAARFVNVTHNILLDLTPDDTALNIRCFNTSVLPEPVGSSIRCLPAEMLITFF